MDTPGEKGGMWGYVPFWQHLMTLDDFFKLFGISDIDPADRDRLVEGWHKLPACPDALQAWPALHKRYILSP